MGYARISRHARPLKRLEIQPCGSALVGNLQQSIGALLRWQSLSKSSVELIADIGPWELADSTLTGRVLHSQLLGVQAIGTLRTRFLICTLCPGWEVILLPLVSTCEDAFAINELCFGYCYIVVFPSV